jgi:hypothetical protein
MPHRSSFAVRETASYRAYCDRIIEEFSSYGFFDDLFFFAAETPYFQVVFQFAYVVLTVAGSSRHEENHLSSV